MKYKTLADLKAAYESGDLDRNDFLMLDNDTTNVYADRGGDEREKVFEGGMPEDLLEQALDLLGIPWEPA